MAVGLQTQRSACQMTGARHGFRSMRACQKLNRGFESTSLRHAVWLQREPAAFP